MDLDNALPGHLVASVFEVLLVDAGYQVIPTGIERTLRELRTVPVDAYIDLVPPRLRAAPDFFVLDIGARQAYLTEIKFRQYLHRALCDDLPNPVGWSKGARLQDIFVRLGKRWEEGTIQKAQDAILRIASRE